MKTDTTEPVRDKVSRSAQADVRKAALLNPALLNPALLNPAPRRRP
jgi:hypothetical protein